jgi:hypothetical protein
LPSQADRFCAVEGTVAVDVTISPWLLVRTMLRRLQRWFGEPRYDMAAVDNVPGHPQILNMYNRPMLGQAVSVTSAGVMIPYDG